MARTAALALLISAGIVPVCAQRLVVRAGDATLRENCVDQKASGILLPAGHEVTLRFALAGPSQRCYAVWAKVGGQVLTGYVESGELEGAGEFEKTLREASAARLVEQTIRTIRIPRAADTGASDGGSDPPGRQAAVRMAIFELQAGRPSEVERILAEAHPPSQSRDAALLRAQALLQLTRPREALEIVRPALAAQPDDPDLLAVAGLGAYLADDPVTARDYLSRSVEQDPNGQITEVLAELRKEVEADQSTLTAYGARFALRYESGALHPESSRRLVEIFEAEASRISPELGCPLPARQPVIVQSVENYRSATESASWSGGHYDGRMRIALPPDADPISHARTVFAHEYVHSCLARMARWPAWFQEGMAQRLSSPPQAEGARGRVERPIPLGLDELSEDWSRLTQDQAAGAYAVSLAAVNLLFERIGPAGVRNLLNNPNELPEFTVKLQNEIANRTAR